METATNNGSTSLRALMFNDNKLDTPNLGDFLRIKDNNNSETTGLTLGDVLSSSKREVSSYPTKTLYDIIHDAPNSSSSNTKPNSSKSWKHFTNKLRIGLVGSTSRDGANAEEEEEDSDDDEEKIEQEHEQEQEQEPVRMSLMALLAENDGDGSAYIIEDEDDDDEEDEERVVVDDGVCFEREGEEHNNCCVCMVRHKGAAFIPCGHTFCRLCSRELWVERGNCPLCNNFILEVLDIF